MTATTPSVDIAALIEQLKERERKLGDPLAVPRSTIAFNRYWEQRRAFADCVSALMNLPHDVAREQARLDDLETRRAAVVAKAQEIERAISDAPQWSDVTDLRERDRRYDHIQHLHKQLRLLREGRLLFAPDATYEPVAQLDKRIADISARRDRLQLSLDSRLQQAEQLLVETSESRV